MLQQTRMEVVLPYFQRFLERFPTLESLAAATDDEVTAAWSGLGYYRRARNLRDGAAAVVARFGGRIPGSVEELLSLPGIGRYSAGAIASIAFNVRAPIVDGNVARVVARLFAIEAPLGSRALEKEAWRIASELVAVCREPRALNQSLMELGALLCTPRQPACLLCPLRSECSAFAEGRVDELPRPKPKQETHAMTIPLFVIRDAAGRLLMQRADGVLMNGMLHLPHGDSSLLGTALFPARRHSLLGTFRHTITNRRIVFEVWSAEPGNQLADGPPALWIAPDELHQHPHPSYVRKALALALRVRTANEEVRSASSE
jgi:A/G-specific adenine glycosylase